MSGQTLLISFDNVSAATANRYAQELRNLLLDKIPNIQAQQKRNDSQTQDAGQILEVILNASSIVALVGVLATWLRLRGGKTLTIKRPEGEIIATGVSEKTLVSLAERFYPEAKEQEAENK